MLKTRSNPGGSSRTRPMPFEPLDLVLCASFGFRILNFPPHLEPSPITLSFRPPLRSCSAPHRVTQNPASSPSTTRPQSPPPP
jgi:hypothetical protein